MEKILQAFERGDKERVTLLLPHIQRLQPHPIEDIVQLRHGYTLLHHAANCGWADVCCMLVEEYRCNPNDTDDFGDSVLHTACSVGGVSVVKYLLSLESVSATVGKKNGSGRTAMEVVATNKYEIYSLFASHIDAKMEFHVDALFKIIIAGT